MQAFVKWRFGAGQRFKAHCTDDIRRIKAVEHALHCFDREGENELCAVDQGQALFWTKADGLHVLLAEYLCGGDPFSLIKTFAQSYQR